MKNITEYLYESLNEAEETEETIENEKDFRAWAHAKFEEVFGDKLDKDKMEETINGFLEDNKDLVDKGEWGELVGKMNESFAPNKAE